MKSSVAVAIALCTIGFVWLRIDSRRNPTSATPSRFQLLRDLLLICVPSFVSKEWCCMLAIVIFSVVRTELMITSARARAFHAKLLVERNSAKFFSSIVDVAVWAIPQAVVGSVTTYLTGRLSQMFRSNLQEFLHSKILSSDSVIKIKQADIDNPDHRMTQDAMMFCYQTVDVFSSLLGPSVDIALLLRQLKESATPIVIGGYYAGTGSVLKMLLPDFAALQAQLQAREGDFRHVHSQIISHAEEVAFYRGETTERENCNRRLDSLIRKHTVMKSFKGVADVAQDILVKYGSTCIGYGVCALPVLAVNSSGVQNASDLAQLFVHRQQLYLPLSQAISKVVRLRQRLALMFGSVLRVGCLVQVLSSERFNRPSEREGLSRSNQIVVKSATIGPTDDCPPLLTNVNISVVPGLHTLVRGSNGVGKSCLMKTIVGVVESRGGLVSRPQSLMMIPQRAYLPPGSLRFQITYPDATCADDKELAHILNQVGLQALFQREGSDLDVVRCWNEMLSGGERQRLVVARALYHKPTFVLLDECTNALNEDDELSLLKSLQSEGLTLITVSHRATLSLIHKAVVDLDEFRVK